MPLIFSLLVAQSAGSYPPDQDRNRQKPVFSLETCHVIEDVKLTHQNSVESGPQADPPPGLELGDRHPNISRPSTAEAREARGTGEDKVSGQVQLVGTMDRSRT